MLLPFGAIYLLDTKECAAVQETAVVAGLILVDQPMLNSEKY